MKKIKILFLHYALVCGGAEQALFDLVSLMDKDKFDITVMVQCDGGIWEDKFREAGVKIVSIWDCQKASHNPFVKARNLYKRYCIKRSIRRDGENLVSVALEQQFDIVVSYSVWSLYAMSFQKNAKSVKFIHGDVKTNQGYAKAIKNQMAQLNKFDRIICVSKAVHQSFMEMTGISENTATHYNPLNSENVKRMSEEDISFPTDLPIICAVGRLSPEKGYVRLIRIHKQLIEEGIKHRLVIVGEGPDRGNMEKTIAELHLENSVTLTGYASNPYPYMKQSKFVVCSSFTEGLPVIAMESLCLGVPVVSAVPSIGEIFGKYDCGLITKNDDQSLADGIRRMLMDSDFYAHIKAGAEERSTFFDGKRMVKEIEDDFIDLIKH